jgi:uncharacterized protein
MDHPTFGNGKICYIEIPSNDINGSADFYETVFGWIIRRDDNGNISFDDSVGEVSGMWVVGRKPATEIGFVISVMVYDLMATIDLIIANGGKILNTDVDSKEKTASFSDPAGNIFVLYQHGRK